MGYGPVPASRLALKRAGLSVNDIDVFELTGAGFAHHQHRGRAIRQS
jgi:acetyl-CoA acetyltransferase